MRIDPASLGIRIWLSGLSQDSCPLVSDFRDCRAFRGARWNLREGIYSRFRLGRWSREPRVAYPEGIHLMIGRRPFAAVGNSTGDQEMLEYTKAGDGERLAMLLLHDDSEREYAYGPAQGLPETKIGTVTQALHDEAKSKGWVVISMKNDWKRVLS